MDAKFPNTIVSHQDHTEASCLCVVSLSVSLFSKDSWRVDDDNMAVLLILLANPLLWILLSEKVATGDICRSATIKAIVVMDLLLRINIMIYYCYCCCWYYICLIVSLLLLFVVVKNIFLCELFYYCTVCN